MFTFPGQTLHRTISKVFFFLCSFMRYVEQAQNFDSKTKTFEKFSKKMIFLVIFPTFEAEVRNIELKILKSRRTKVVPIKCSHLF
jgi:hypothetical protein